MQLTWCSMDLEQLSTWCSTASFECWKPTSPASSLAMEAWKLRWWLLVMYSLDLQLRQSTNVWCLISSNLSNGTVHWFWIHGILDADAVIKCFATAVSTGILLYISPIFFDVDFSFILVPGTVLVFVATWLYMEAAPLRKGKAKLDCGVPLSNPSAQSILTKVCVSINSKHCHFLDTIFLVAYNHSANSSALALSLGYPYNRHYSDDSHRFYAYAFWYTNARRKAIEESPGY